MSDRRLRARSWFVRLAVGTPFVIGAVVLGLALAGRAARRSHQILFEGDSVQQPEWGSRIVTQHDMEIERARIAAHLGRVEAKLRSRDVSTIPVERRVERERLLDMLREYRERGIFPHNHVVTDRRTPVFVDEHGTPCAVGYMIARSGHPDLTRRIARTRNRATIAELAEDEKLKRWLETAGLTLTEAAMIQPSYGPDSYDSQADAAAYATATIVATGLNGGMIAWNLLAAGSGSRQLPGILGLTCGLGQTVLGAVGFPLDEPDRDLETAHIAANLIVGSVAVVLGAMTLSRDARETREAHTLDRRDIVAPDAVAWKVSGWTSAEVDAGVQLGIRF